MELVLQREPSVGLTTLGSLCIDGVFECITLEDVVRLDDPLTPEDEGIKVYGETAIPAGQYQISVTFSPKFNKLMILVMDVPGFTGIRIHSGNDKDDTLGCILVGTTKDSITRIHGGNEALPKLRAKIDAALAKSEQIWVTIKNPEGLN